MTDRIHHIGSEIIESSRDRRAGKIAVTVELRFTFCDEIRGPSKETSSKQFIIIQDASANWRKTKKNALEKAWKRLESYFSGDCLEGDSKNIFATDFEGGGQTHTELPPEQELSLQQELRQIELEFKSYA
ncbi:hypothetical protein [Roseovarius sp. MMSF_3281]|uniref:hypothetical protein n=1 Tax=Roseovarius sp. MMSF_3281 TaxID=3046694 RepID=UPI00273E7D9F|nr:hypothetical protein [Roseovarius sp. MMSF_3281]